jgi:uncharacterized protein
MPAATAPVPARIAALDVLRGVAILGILLLNVTGYGLPYVAYDDPSVWGGATGASWWAWFLSYVVFDGKMRGMLSILFGAGIMLYTADGRAAEQERAHGLSAADLWHRRHLWMLVLGLVDGYLLLWSGDILYAYAICGLLLWSARRLRPRTQLLAGVAALAILTGMRGVRIHDSRELRATVARADSIVARGGALTPAQTAAKAKLREKLAELKPDSAAVAKEIATVRGGYREVFAWNAKYTREAETTGIYVYFWEFLGAMLIGMGLLQSGVLTGRRSTRWYLGAGALSYAAGIPLTVAVARTYEASGFALDVFPMWWAFQPARMLVAFGHICALLALCRVAADGAALRALAATGRMALSNYLFQTIACGFVFYGYGLGLFGRLSRAELYWVVLGMLVVEVAASRWWLARFRLGPAEWLWRSLTYWRPQPMRLRPAEAAPVLAGSPSPSV